MKQKFAGGAVFVILAVVAFLIWSQQPEVSRRGERLPQPISISSMEVQRGPYQVILSSNGVVQPLTQSTLLPQVSGEIVELGPHFRDGSYFGAGEVLLKIDPRRYRWKVKIAEADWKAALQFLAEERSRGRQAEDDWLRSGNPGEAPAIVLRMPQLAAAEAQVAATLAKLGQARLDLEYTTILAPYAGRVRDKRVDLGQAVSPATILAEVFAVDAVEIRLPLKNSELGLIDLPENYPDRPLNVTAASRVVLTSTLGATASRWTGVVVRTESAVDELTNQLHVIARLKQPFEQRTDGALPLKIGQYVDAEIDGRLLDAVIVIPAYAVYQGSFVYVVQADVLERREIEITWRNDREVLVRSGLESGDNLVLTTLGQVSSGTAVRVLDRAGKEPQQQEQGSTRVSGESQP